MTTGKAERKFAAVLLLVCAGCTSVTTPTPVRSVLADHVAIPLEFSNSREQTVYTVKQVAASRCTSARICS